MKLRVGTRGSLLAVKQTLEVIEEIKKIFPEIEFEIVRIKTKGDVMRSSIRDIGSPGIFTKEIDLELMKGSIDLAIHSLKDYPTKTPEDLDIAAIPRRRSRRDAIIPKSRGSLEAIHSGAIIGTGSLRRASHILYHRRDLSVKAIRGNIDTRIRKIGVEVDAVVLAEAGLQRIGHNDYEPVSPYIITPQAGQGALAVVARKGSEAVKIASMIDDPISRIETSIERGFISALKAGCRAPVGVTAEAGDNGITVIVSLVSPDYISRIYFEERYQGLGVDEIVNKIFKRFEREGGLELVEEWSRKTSGGLEEE
ncbi:MAG: hydroxymethylbilane synthase [Sulfolobales archaeon]